MASRLLSEEHLLCPICLDFLTQPVSTPCGHNFCTSCLTTHWNDKTVCTCPVCKETFERRPKLKVNTFISELVSQFMVLKVADAQVLSTDQLTGNSGSATLCDVCTGIQQEAVKSCLECLTSYCDVHLEPHHRAAGLKRHTLVGPLANLEDKICKTHNLLVVLFCQTDRVLLCDVCAHLQHTDHNVVPVQQAYKVMKDILGDTEVKVQQMIHERKQKVQTVKESVKESKKETEDVIEKGIQDLIELVDDVQKSQTEIVKVIEEKQKTAEEQADDFISSVEKELTELERTAKTLTELKQTKDQIQFLHNFPNASLLPRVTDLSTFSFNRRKEIKNTQKSLSGSVSQLRTLLNKMIAEINNLPESRDATLCHLQQYEVNVFLDPNTAHPLLLLSDDCKQVRYNMGSVLWGTRNLNPNMFLEHLAVLGQRSFSSRKFYFEVFVGQKTEWCLGVARASVQRMGGLQRCPESGLWAIWFLEDKFETFSCPGVTVYSSKVERVGVFVDCDGGQISFYDVQTAELIYSFEEALFTEELYPYLNPCDNEYGSNLDPMVIVPVSRGE